MIGFQRHKGHRAFGRREAHSFGRLLPHLQRALRLMLHFQKLTDDIGFGEALFEVSNLATLALSSSGQVLWANRLGLALLRAGTWFHEAQGRLCASNPDGNACLQLAIRQALAEAKPSSVNLGAKGGPEHCCLTLIALKDAQVIPLSASRAALLAVITTNSGQRIATVQQLMDFFRLTPAEARLVRALAHGETVDEYASHEQLKRATVKTQLQAALAKTGTRSQRDLVCLVRALPATRG